MTVVDPTGMHDYQPGYLYVALGEAKGHWLSREERTLLRPGVDLAIEKAVRIHPDAGTVQLERGGSLDWDYLVIATGSRLVPEQIPGLSEGAFEFYSLDGAERLAQELRRFDGGRLKVGVAGIPYKCPPAPVEFTFMVEEYLRHKGVRDKSEIELLSPLNRAFTIESASKLIQPYMDERGIGLTTFFNVEAVDPSAGVVESLEGEKQEYDLLVLVPPHKGAQVVIDSELGDPGGWLPTDKHTLNVEGHERIFATRRRDEPADLEVGIDRALRGARDREPYRVARERHGPEGELRRPGDVLPRDRQRPGDVAAVRLRAPAGAAEAQPRLAHREVAVQPHVLGDGAAGAHPRERAVLEAPALTLRTKE